MYLLDRHAFVYFLTFFLAFTLVDISTQNDEQKLFDHLFKKHKTDVRPMLHQNKSLAVRIGITIIQILKLEEQSQTVTMKVWLRLFWKNEFLTWNPKDWNGIERLLVNPKLLWLPDIVLYDHIDERLMKNDINTNAMIGLLSNGRIWWGRPLIFTTSCHIDVTYFPFDRQTCTLLFASWMHDRSLLDLKSNNDPFITKQYVHNLEWDLVHTSGKIHTEDYDGLSEDISPASYVNFIVTYTLQRKPLYYMFNVLVPCAILMSIILIGFFFPINSGERVSIVVTILLTYTVFLDLVNSALPTTSVSVPALSVFYITIMAESAISLVATCVVLIVHHRGEEKGIARIPSWIRRYMYSVVVMKYLGMIHWDTNRKNNEKDEGLQEASGIDNKCCDYRNSNDTHGSRESQMLPQLQIFDKYAGKVQPSAPEGSSASLENIPKEVEGISPTLDDSRGDEIESEWKYLAKILDRLFFFLFTILFFVTSVAILVPAYVHARTQEDSVI